MQKKDSVGLFPRELTVDTAAARRAHDLLLKLSEQKDPAPAQRVPDARGTKE